MACCSRRHSCAAAGSSPLCHPRLQAAACSHPTASSSSQTSCSAAPSMSEKLGFSADGEGGGETWSGDGSSASEKDAKGDDDEPVA